MTASERNLLTTAGVVVVGAAIVVYGFWPTLTSYKQTRVSIAAARTDMAAIDGRVAALAAAKQKLDAASSSVQRLQLAVPADEQYPELINELVGAGDSAQVSVSGIQPLQSSATTQGVGVTATVTGSYEQLLAFVKNLEQNIRPVNVQTMSFVGGGDPKDPTRISATIQMIFAALPSASASATGGAQ